MEGWISIGNWTSELMPYNWMDELVPNIWANELVSVMREQYPRETTKIGIQLNEYGGVSY